MDRVLKCGWLALFAAPMLVSATGANEASKDTVLSVSGVGYSTSEGVEVFTIRAGSRSFSGYPARAIRDNASTLEQLRKQLAGNGIDKRDISNANFEFRRGSDPDDNDGDRDEGYIASQQLVVFVRNTDQAGAVIEALVEAGATDVSVHNSRGWWGADRPPPAIEAAARKQAVADARKKADDYAAALGMRISRIVSVNDGGVRITGEPAPMARAMNVEVGTKIDNGESAVVASVNMQFELTPKR